MGLILTLCSAILYVFGFEQLTINITVVVLLVFVTGGMHLDGLADTFDGLTGSRDREEMLRIMRDSRIGAMGVIAVCCALLLKVALLASIPVGLRNTALVLMCVNSRWSLAAQMSKFSYARDTGKAKAFMENKDRKIFYMSSVVAAIIVFVIWPFKGLLTMFLSGSAGYLFCKHVNSRLQGITGDTLGASNEIVEIVTLFCICLI